jgi:hypothetical protein
MKLIKVQYRDYCFRKRNKVQHEGYFKTDSNNFYLINNTTIGYCVWYNSKRFNI